jgi:hypothetical protein
MVTQLAYKKLLGIVTKDLVQPETLIGITVSFVESSSRRFQNEWEVDILLSVLREMSSFSRKGSLSKGSAMNVIMKAQL